MSKPRRAFESELIDQLAHRYERQGYAVSREVLLEGSSLRADLVARRGDETVLVEVRPSTREANPAPLSELAAYSESHGWRFSVVLAREDGSTEEEEVEIPTRDQVMGWIADARSLAPSSWVASVAAAAAFEAAARHALAHTERRSLPRRSPTAHLQALASAGLVTLDEERVLQTVIEARNAAAHGIKMPPIPEDVVPKTLAIAASLVESEPTDK